MILIPWLIAALFTAIKSSWIKKATGSGLGCAGFGGYVIVHLMALAIPFVLLAWVIKPEWFLGDPTESGGGSRSSSKTLSLLSPEATDGTLIGQDPSDIDAVKKEYCSYVRMASGATLVLGILVFLAMSASR